MASEPNDLLGAAIDALVAARYGLRPADAGAWRWERRIDCGGHHTAWSARDFFGRYLCRRI